MRVLPVCLWWPATGSPCHLVQAMADFLQHHNDCYVIPSFAAVNQPHPRSWVTGQALAKHTATTGTSKNGGGRWVLMWVRWGRLPPHFPLFPPVFPPLWRVRFSWDGTFRPLHSPGTGCILGQPGRDVAKHAHVLIHLPTTSAAVQRTCGLPGDIYV